MKPVRFRRISPTRFRAELGRISLGLRFKKPKEMAEVAKIERVISRALWRDDRKAKRRAIATMRNKNILKARRLKR